MFRQLTSQTLHQLRPLLESKLPTSAMVLNMVDMTLKGKYPAGHKVDFYSFNGVPKDPERVFLDICVHPKYQPTHCSVFWTPENPTEDMLDAFREHHDWSKSHTMEAVNYPLADELVKIVIEKGGGLTLYPTSVLYLPLEDAKKIDLRAPSKYEDLWKQFELDTLLPEHCEKINMFWKYGFPEGAKMLKESLKTMGGVGLFRKKTKQNRTYLRSPDNLVGWLCLQHIGTLGALYTVDEYRGRGLAKFVMEAGSKWLAEQGLIPVVEVEDYNLPSFKVMEAIGYKHIQSIYWVEYDPVT